MIVIEMVRNGWIVRDKQDDDQEHVYVFDEGDTDKYAIESFSRLLWLVTDLCAPTTSRYSAHRISIKIEPGDKWEGDHESPQPRNDKGVEPKN